MNGRYLLDTSVLIALYANDRSVLGRLARNPEVYVSSIVLGELYYGAYHSSHPASNIRRVDELADRAFILSCDTESARHYGRVKNSLRSRGRTLPENDIWIAAVCQQHGLTLVTRDRHFQEVPELSLDEW